MPAKTEAAPEAPVTPRLSPAGFMRVDHPTMWPQACIICQSAKGPLVDTSHETTNGRLYVCSQCVKWLALELGLVDGARMDELLDADTRLATANAERVDLRQQVQGMLTDGATQTRKIEALEELLQQARDEERTRRNLLEQIGQLSKQLLQQAN